MFIAPGFVGIDISKDHLDIFDGRARRITNTEAAIAAELENWQGGDAFVLFEATGAYDRCLRQQLDLAGIAYVRVNPARARDFARATGRLAKTDAIDAKLLAAMAQALRPQAADAPDPERQALAGLAKRRDQLVAMRKQERTRLHTAEPAIVADVAAHIDWLDDRIRAVEMAIQSLIGESPKLQAAQELLRSIPGIGPVGATTILALMPEAGTLSPKTAAALAGLAPMNADSGNFRGKRAIKGGRPRVRQASYMAALTATQATTALPRASKPSLAPANPSSLPSSPSPAKSSSSPTLCSGTTSPIDPDKQYSCRIKSGMTPSAGPVSDPSPKTFPISYMS
jgi:transposase